MQDRAAGCLPPYNLICSTGGKTKNYEDKDREKYKDKDRDRDKDKNKNKYKDKDKCIF